MEVTPVYSQTAFHISVLTSNITISSVLPATPAPLALVTMEAAVIVMMSVWPSTLTLSPLTSTISYIASVEARAGVSIIEALSRVLVWVRSTTLTALLITGVSSLEARVSLRRRWFMEATSWNKMLSILTIFLELSPDMIPSLCLSPSKVCSLFLSLITRPDSVMQCQHLLIVKVLLTQLNMLDSRYRIVSGNLLLSNTHTRLSCTWATFYIRQSH